MRNQNITDEEYNYDYSPNELAELNINNPQKYRDVVNSNLSDNDTIEDWEQRNLERIKKLYNQK